MIKYWQSMHDYKYFLTESKVHFDFSERNRLHTKLWKAWQKLRLFDTDKAMGLLLPFYSPTGRPARNQPQILRSFILFFLLYSEGFAKPSLTLWVDRLKGDRVLASLIGCPTDSLPPLGSYLDFMDRLWAAPKTDLYARGKLLPASWNSKKPDKPKGKKHRRQSPRSPKRLKNGSWPGRISLLTLRSSSSNPSIMSPSCLPWNAASYLRSTLTFPATAPPSIPMPAPAATTGMAHLITCAISPPPTLPGAGTATWINFTSATLCSSYPAITMSSGRTSRCSCVLPAQDGMIWSASSSLSMKWKNICLDSAMDNYPTYRLLKIREVRAFIDLNDKCGRPKTIPDTIH